MNERQTATSPAERVALNRPGYWECERCTAHNRDERDICGVCDAARSRVVLKTVVPIAPLSIGTIYIELPPVILQDVLTDLHSFLTARGHAIERTYHTLSIVPGRR